MTTRAISALLGVAALALTVFPAWTAQTSAATTEVTAQLDPGSCTTDSECAADEVCESGQCVVPAPLTPEELVEEACPCDADWRGHGEYVRCVVEEVFALELDRSVAAHIISTAARSSCGF